MKGQAARFACFVTGTDTGVGKTLVTCALIHALTRQGMRVAGMKPVAAGAELSGGVWRNEDAEALAAESNVALPPELTTPYLLKTPCAPHVAAEIEGVSIDGARILDCYRQVAQLADAVVVEGVGGFRVPLTDTLDTADLAVQFDLPVVLVVGLRLGCLSQALLTAEAVAARGLELAGWVANDVDPGMAYRAENVAALTARLPAPLLGTLPRMTRPTTAEIAARLDFFRLTGWPKSANTAT